MANELKYLVIHCTATPEHREVKASELREWHTAKPPKGNGWRQVGYTDMLHLSGAWERLTDNNEDGKVDPWEVTNGVAGHNGVSRHIVYVGGLDKQGKPKDTRTAAQRASLATYVKDFHKKHPTVRIVGHGELAKKDCPCFDVQGWLKSIGIAQ